MSETTSNQLANFASSSMKINVIGIGAQKCASTWLYGMLAEHPEASVSTDKELDFFSSFYDRGYYWYEQQFEPNPSGTILAEVSPSYFCDSDAPARAYKYNPDMKVVLTLRHPIKRSLSNHRHEIRVMHAVKDDWSFETGLANNPMYIEQGYYAKHLKKWLEVFPREQVHVVLMDDIKAQGEQTVQALYKFVGINSDHQPDSMSKSYNKSFVNKNENLARVKDSVYSLSRRPPISWLWNIATLIGLRKLYRHLNQQDSEQVIPDPSQSTLDELADLYENDIAELEKLLGRSLDAWRS